MLLLRCISVFALVVAARASTDTCFSCIHLRPSRERANAAAYDQSDSRSEPTASSHDVGEHCVTKSCSVLTSWVTLAFSGHDSWSTADQLIDSRETEVRTHARSVKDKLNIDASCRSTVEARLDPQMADSSYWSCSAVNAVTTAIELLTTALVY